MMKMLILILFAVSTAAQAQSDMPTRSQNFAGQEVEEKQLVVSGMSDRATPIGDQRVVIESVIQSAKENAQQKLPQGNFVQASDWETSYFYSGSRIYGAAKATFLKSDLAATLYNWKCTLSETGPDDVPKQIESKLLESKMNETVKHEFFIRQDLWAACFARAMQTASYGVVGSIYAAACSFYDRSGNTLLRAEAIWPNGSISSSLSFGQTTYRMTCDRIPIGR